MRVLWVTRSVADYRVPVFSCLAARDNVKLTLIYSKQRSAPRVCAKIEAALGERAVGLTGEWRFRAGDVVNQPCNGWTLITYQRGVIARARGYSPDVLIGDGFFQWSVNNLYLRLRYRIPNVVLYERTAITEQQAQWYRKLYRKIALHYADAVCCNGRLSREYTQSLGYPARRITIGHMTADTTTLAAAAECARNGEASEVRRKWVTSTGRSGETPVVVFLYVGRLIRLKGLRELLQGWKLFRKARPSSCHKTANDRLEPLLVVAGEGPERAVLASCLEDTSDSVVFVGNVDYEKLAAVYAAADAFIIASLADNWSLVVPEAMACGLAVLCSKHNGCWPELVREGRNGWVFNPLDPADIARCLADACAPWHLGDTSLATRADSEEGREKAGLGAHRRLRMYGAESKRIIADFSPRHAAEAIYTACEIAIRQVRQSETGR